MDEFKKSNAEYAKAISTKSRSTLLIVDRLFDIVTPLLHEPTYQSMVYDLLPIEEDQYKFKSDADSKETKLNLTDSDPIWQSMRHKPIEKAMYAIANNFAEFKQKNQSSDKDLIKNTLTMYSLHINMSKSAKQKWDEKGLQKLSALEQEIATGESEVHVLKNSLSSMNSMLGDEKVDKQDKLRVLLAYIVAQGDKLKDENRKKLIDSAKLSTKEQAAITNLKFMGVKFHDKPAPKEVITKHEKHKNETPEISKHIPAVHLLLENVIQGQLDDGEYPAVKDAKSEAPKHERVIIFVAGGVTHSELRHIYDLGSRLNSDIILGSTTVVSPSDFVRSLSSLKRT